MHTSDIPIEKNAKNPIIIPDGYFEKLEENLGIKLHRFQKESLALGEAVLFENVHLPNNTIADAKVKLQLNKENEIEMKLFEKKEVLEIPERVLGYKLTDKDKEDLLAEKLVAIKPSSGQNLFVMIDRSLNRIMVHTERDLKLMTEIGNYKLNDRDKLAWSNGEKLPLKIFYDEKTQSHFAASIRKTEDGKGIEYHDYKSLKGSSEEQIKDLISKHNNGPDIINTATNLANSIKTEVVKNEVERNSGILLDHGSAPFENNKDNSLSYFAKIKTETGEKIVWGVDLNRAINESQANIGDSIKLDYMGSQPVKINFNSKDDKGNVIVKEIETHRNTWNVEKVINSKTTTLEVSTSHDNDRRFVEYTNNRDFDGLRRLAQEGYKPERDLIDRTAQQLNLSTEDKKSVMTAIGNETQKQIPVIKEKDFVVLTLNNKPYQVIEFSENGKTALLKDSQNKKIGVSVENIRLMSKKEKGVLVGSAKKVNIENSIQL